MAFEVRILKATRSRVVTVNTGVPVILGGMNLLGVTGARLGRTELFVPFSVFYDLPLPFANVPFTASMGDLVAGGVWAFPMHGPGIPGEGSGSTEPSNSMQYRKPKYPRS